MPTQRTASPRASTGLLGTSPEDDGGFAVLQLATTFLLPHIKPGQDLEEVAT